MKIKILLLAICLTSIRLLNAAEYNIVDFGAVRGQLSTTAIQKAVDACFSAGGGRVLVPAGTFITGSIILKSNVNLYLENGAILQGSKDIKDYSRKGRSPGMVYCEDAINVGISGTGIIDGSGDSFYDFSKSHVYDEFDKSKVRQKENYMPEGTFFTDGPMQRTKAPGMTIVFFHCTNVFITGITIKDTPIWATRFGFCDGVLIDGITIKNNPVVPNSDGIHCTISRNIRISNCNIVAGDDCIVLTGFPKDEDTPGLNTTEQKQPKYGNKTIYGENMTVTNCVLKSNSAGIRIGYGQHPIRRCTFSNIVIYDSHRGIGIFAHDGSNIEDLIFSDIIIETRLLNGQWWGHGEPIHLSCISRFPGLVAGQIKNVQFNNINAIGEQGILVFGQKESPMENIQFNNVQLRMRKGKETMGYAGNFDLRPASPKEMQLFEHDIPGIYAQNVNKLAIRNFNLSWGSDLPSFFTHGIECQDVDDLLIDEFVGTGNPNAPGSQKIKLVNSTYLKETN
ncbi:MAG TPA: glycosyl hydrolase family 28 protein [Prolixibacteraceae bacterium]